MSIWGILAGFILYLVPLQFFVVRSIPQPIERLPLCILVSLPSLLLAIFSWKKQRKFSIGVIAGTMICFLFLILSFVPHNLRSASSEMPIKINNTK